MGGRAAAGRRPAGDRAASFIKAVVNPALVAFLRSRWHGLLSDRFLVLAIGGRRSGRVYTFPLGYLRDGDTVTIASNQGWWVNARAGNVPVTLWLGGRRRQGLASASRDEAVVAAELPRFLARSPALARLYRVERGADGRYTAESVRAAAREVAIVHIRLVETAARAGEDEAPTAPRATKGAGGG